MPLMNRSHSPGGRLLVAAAILALLLGLALALLQRPAAPPQDLQATLLSEPRPLAPFQLIDHHSQPFDNSGLAGHWTFMFFGYTHCPDVCPTTLSVLNSVARRIGEQSPARDARFLFVSVDPARDTPEQLGKFVPFFNPAFMGVTGDAEAIRGLTRQLGILYLLGEANSEGGYLVDHSAAILLLDPQGRFYALFSPPHDPDTMAKEFRQMAEYYEDSQ